MIIIHNNDNNIKNKNKTIPVSSLFLPGYFFQFISFSLFLPVYFFQFISSSLFLSVYFFQFISSSFFSSLLMT